MKYLVLLMLFCGAIFAQDCGLQPGFLAAKVNISFAWVGSTTHSQTYNGEFLGTETETSCERTVIDLVPSYTASKKGSGVPIITRNFDGKIEQLIFYPGHPHFFNYVIGEEYHNNSLGVLLRQSYGTGIGYIFGRFEMDVDARWINEEFYKPGIRNSDLVGIALKPHYSIPMNFIAKSAVLAVGEEFIPVLNKQNAWMANSVAALSIPFKPKWYFTISGNDTFLADSPYTYRRNYTKVSFGITFDLNGVVL